MDQFYNLCLQTSSHGACLMKRERPTRGAEKRETKKTNTQRGIDLERGRESSE